MQFLSFLLLIGTFFFNVILTSDGDSEYSLTSNCFLDSGKESSLLSKKVSSSNSGYVEDQSKLEKKPAQLSNIIQNEGVSRFKFPESPLKSILNDSSRLLSIDFATTQLTAFLSLLNDQSNKVKGDADCVALYCIKLFYEGMISQRFICGKLPLLCTRKIYFTPEEELQANSKLHSLTKRKIMIENNSVITLGEYIEKNKLQENIKYYTLITKCLQYAFTSCYYNLDNDKNCINFEFLIQKRLNEKFIDQQSPKEKNLYEIIINIFEFKKEDLLFKSQKEGLSLVKQYIENNGFTPIEKKTKIENQTLLQKRPAKKSNKYKPTKPKKIKQDPSENNSMSNQFNLSQEQINDSNDNLDEFGTLRCKNLQALQNSNYNLLNANINQNGNNNNVQTGSHRENNNMQLQQTEKLDTVNEDLSQNNLPDGSLNPLQLIALFTKYINNDLTEINKRITDNQITNEQKIMQLVELLKSENQQSENQQSENQQRNNQQSNNQQRNNQQNHVILMNNFFTNLNILLSKNSDTNKVIGTMDKFFEIMLNMQYSQSEQNNCTLSQNQQLQNNPFLNQSQKQPHQQQSQLQVKSQNFSPNNQNSPKFGVNNSEKNISYIMQKPNPKNEKTFFSTINPQSSHMQNKML